ncbi:MAG: helix-turn-helix domain-containing protein [Kangiellaceae bacterium]|nr:helix-turn-helix domain-containing protein [Kangiellaceae bacterium]
MSNQLKLSSNPIIGIDRFSDSVNQAFCPMNCESVSDIRARNFQGQLVSNTLNKMHIARISSSALDVNRSKQHISEVSGCGYYLVKFQMKGEGIVQQCGREAHLRQGDFVICSSSEPYKLLLPTDYYQAVLTIPQTMLQDIFHSPDDYLGIRMNSQFPIHGILSQFMFSLTQRLDLLEPEIIHRLEANILDLLITSLRSEEKVTRVLPDNSVELHLQRIKRYIELNFKDPGLSPEDIAKAVNISKRYLHKLFKEEGTSVSTYIKKNRLDACRRALVNPELQHLKTIDIALDNGFGDVSHFHRCFKAEFEMTPRQFRIKHLAILS